MSDYFRRLPPPYQTINDRPSDLETPESPRSPMSLAPSSRAGSSYTRAKRHKETTARSHPYDVKHHSKSKASTACVQGASDEWPQDQSIARPGDDSLKYAQGLVFYPPSGSSRSGVHPPLQTPWADAFQFTSGYLTHITLDPSSIRSPTTPSANQAQSLPQSLTLAAQLAENEPSRPPAAPAAPASVPTFPVSVRPEVHRGDSSQQDERNNLAELLREYLQTNPEPTIGSQDNPFPFADPRGIKGLSILSALFEHEDMETFTCTSCGDIQTDVDAALEHQRIFLQTCVDV